MFSQNKLTEKSFLFVDSLFIKNLDVLNSKPYIDSAVFYAKKNNKKNDLAYIYSSIGFFFNKINEYDKSLYYFDKSNHYAKELDNKYIINSNFYSLSIVFYQLGNYKESKIYLEKSYKYFTNNQNSQSNKLALLNILNRLSFIESINNNISKAKFYNNLEFKYSKDSIISKNFNYMKSLSLKNKGIILYNEMKYKEAINYLNRSVKPLKDNNINYWTTIVYSYLGNSHLAVNEEKKAYDYFIKVDSIFKKNKTTDPIIRNSLENLKELNKKNHSIEVQFNSINTLIEFDSLNNIRNTSLSNKFYNEFIGNNLREEKRILENKLILKEHLNILLFIVFAIICIITIIIFIRSLRLKIKFKRVLNIYISEINNLKNIHIEDNPNKIPKIIKNDNQISQTMIDDILKKISELEKDNFFLDMNTNLNDMAKKLNTNTNYLSYIINKKKGMNFPTYIDMLRINYIIKELIKNKKIRSMSIDGIAYTAGFKTRQKFSNTFLNITGIRPSYFISNIDKINIDDYLN